MRIILVAVARPEEASQAISAASGHDVNVQMRNGLAHAVVHGNKGSVRVQRGFDSAGDLLCPEKHRAGMSGGKVKQRFAVLARAKQYVTRK